MWPVCRRKPLKEAGREASVDGAGGGDTSLPSSRPEPQPSLHFRLHVKINFKKVLHWFLCSFQSKGLTVCCYCVEKNENHLVVFINVLRAPDATRTSRKCRRTKPSLYLNTLPVPFLLTRYTNTLIISFSIVSKYFQMIQFFN